MNASELHKAARLAEATAVQTQEVRAHPADNCRRLFLFELLTFAGDLDRARRQIEAVEYSDMELDAAVLAYRKLVDVAAQRPQNRTAILATVAPFSLVFLKTLRSMSGLPVSANPLSVSRPYAYTQKGIVRDRSILRYTPTTVDRALNFDAPDVPLAIYRGSAGSAPVLTCR
jgi:hypothetical protein